MRQLIIAILILVTFATYAEDPKYPVSAIPEELKADVNAVIRDYEEVYTIVARDRATQYIRRAVTILNPNGKEYAYENIDYDKLTKVSYVKAYVYDANGKLINKLKSSEIYDHAAYQSDLFTDNRVKSINLSQGTYPYTVEIEYQLEYKFLFYIPSYWAIPDEKVSVINSSYTLEYPEEFKPRYKTHGVDVKAVESISEAKRPRITWKFANLKPVKIEPLSGGARNFLPHIDTAPTLFRYDDYEGSMADWNSFGKWIISLNEGRGVLPDATKQKIKSLTANAKSDEEKIKILYEYLQSKTRYVSIQLGIGGFQPFEASVVDQTGYGDCKALSNYMVAMLKEVGIKANYTLISAGSNPRPLDASFPSTQFNHAIVCVPNAKDTLWLECTSQTNPFGFQGKFTGDRRALIITDDGAKIVNTTRYSAEQNLQSRVADVTVDATGNAKAVVKTIYSGVQYENGGLSFIINDQYDKQKEWLENNMGIPSFNMGTFSMKNYKARIPSAEVKIDLTLPRYASVSGKRLFLTPNLMNRSTFIPEKVDSRKSDVVLRQAFMDVDTIKYHLPEGIYPEFLPEPVSIKSRFGEYESKYVVDQGSLVYIRRMTGRKGEYPAASYQELIDFYKSVNKADNTKLVFLNKT